MAISAFFHRNVLLLNQIIQPNDEFKKHFREGMFDKPNTAGFLHISHYLLTVYDADRFKKLFEWPITCKKTEVKYRNNVKDYLTIISAENPDVAFPTILMSRLIHAGGSKFTIIMWKLSQVVIRSYITQQTMYNVTYMPQIGYNEHIAKTFLSKMNAIIHSHILYQHNYVSEMENTTKLCLEQEKEKLAKIIGKIFENEPLLKNRAHNAPVHPSITKCLMDINNGEVIKMWKKNISDGLNKIRKKNQILKHIEQLTSRVYNIILSYSSDIKILDIKELQKVNTQGISELLSPDLQCLLFELHTGDKLQLNNFILLFNLLLRQLYHCLKLNTLHDFSDYFLQIEACCTDVKSAFDVIQSYMLDLIKMKSATQNILYQKNVIQVDDNNVLPIMSNVLITLSPLIKIDTNCGDEEADLQKRLQLTPVEAAHKSLFSRYQRPKENHLSQSSKLRENLLVSRINFNDTISTIASEKQYLSINAFPSRKNLTSLKQAQKYSRLFSTRTKRNNKIDVNTSIMSIPCSSKANSTAIANAIEGIQDISGLSLNISGKSLCNESIEFATPEKAKQDDLKSAAEMENKTNVPDICEKIEMERKNNCDNNILKIGQPTQRRRSIGDLVERYKKLVKTNNSTPSPKLSYIKCEEE